MAAIPNIAYWRITFGIENFQEFEAATKPLFDHRFGLLPLAPIGTIQEFAYTFPNGPSGVAASAYLAAQGYVGSERAAANATASNVFDLMLPDILMEVSAMPGLVIPDCFQVNINMVSGGQPVVNVIGVRNASGSALGAAEAVRAAWKAANGPLSGLLLHVVMVNFTATDISSLNGEIAVVPDTTTGGVASGSLATNAACGLVKWNGGTRSRSSRGRLYYGPIGEHNINPDGRTLTTVSAALFTTEFNQFRNGLATAGYELVVLSRVQQTAYPVTSAAVETVIATQRRRIRS